MILWTLSPFLTCSAVQQARCQEDLVPVLQLLGWERQVTFVSVFRELA